MKSYNRALSRFAIKDDKQDFKSGTAIRRFFFIELCRRVRVKFPRS